LKKVAILQFQREGKLAKKECDLGFEHLVPDTSENVWFVIEDCADLTDAETKAFKEYPPEKGWKARFGTINAVKLE